MPCKEISVCKELHPAFWGQEGAPAGLLHLSSCQWATSPSVSSLVPRPASHPWDQPSGLLEHLKCCRESPCGTTHILAPRELSQLVQTGLADPAKQDQQVNELDTMQPMGTEAMGRSRVGWKPSDLSSALPSVQLMSCGKGSQMVTHGMCSSPEGLLIIGAALRHRDGAEQWFHTAGSHRISYFRTTV